MNDKDEIIVEGCGLPLSEFKDSMGRYRLNIFYEFNRREKEKYPAIYTMREFSWKGLPSARQIYMNSADEYEAAMKLVGSWDHWKRLLKCTPFMKGAHPESGFTWEGLEQWREEKRIRDESYARQLLWDSAEKGNVTAQRILFEGKSPKSGAGRPSNDKVRKEAREMAERDEMIKEDLKRIKGLSVVK